jgi:hypothetical protein
MFDNIAPEEHRAGAHCGSGVSSVAYEERKRALFIVQIRPNIIMIMLRCRVLPCMNSALIPVLQPPAFKDLTREPEVVLVDRLELAFGNAPATIADDLACGESIAAEWGLECRLINA